MNKLEGRRLTDGEPWGKRVEGHPGEIPVLPQAAADKLDPRQPRDTRMPRNRPGAR